MKISFWRLIFVSLSGISFGLIIAFPLTQTLAAFMLVAIAWVMYEIAIVQQIELGTQKQIVLLIKALTPKKDEEPKPKDKPVR